MMRRAIVGAPSPFGGRPRWSAIWELNVWLTPPNPPQATHAFRQDDLSTGGPQNKSPTKKHQIVRSIPVFGGMYSGILWIFVRCGFSCLSLCYFSGWFQV